MTRRFVPAILLLALFTPLAGFSQGIYSKDFKRSVDFESGGHLTLETHKGTIRLSSWERNQVEIVARIEADEDVSPKYAERSVEATRVDVWGGARSLTIRSDYRDVPCQEEAWFFACSKELPYIHYEIRAPRSLDFRLKDHKSDIRITGFEGRVQLDTYKGSVQGRDLAGEVRLDTYKGRIDLAGLRGRVQAETYKGDMALEADEINGNCRLETYKGKVLLALPEAQGFFLRADIHRRGDFDSDFGITMRTVSRQRWEGSINRGGPEIYVRTHKGEIRLRRR